VQPDQGDVNYFGLGKVERMVQGYGWNLGGDREVSSLVRFHMFFI